MRSTNILRRTAAFFILAIGLAAPAWAERGPSTPEERERVVKLAEAANRDPIGVMTSTDGRWFMKWSKEVPDYMFGPDKAAFWMDSGTAKGDLRRVMRFHHMLSTASYQVQHEIKDPESDAAAMEAKTIAGLDGLLHAYESLKDKNPENRSEELDKAVAMRDQGKLAAFVQSLPPAPKR